MVTDSRLTSMMGLSLEVWGKVLACRLGSRMSLRPSYSSSWLCSGMLVLRDSSSWNSTALWTQREQHRLKPGPWTRPKDGSQGQKNPQLRRSKTQLKQADQKPD